MQNCEMLPTCPFFNDKMSKQPATAQSMKTRYCMGGNSLCARYLVVKTLGKEKVPANLFPNQMDKAKNLIDQNN